MEKIDAKKEKKSSNRDLENAKEGQKVVFKNLKLSCPMKIVTKFYLFDKTIEKFFLPVTGCGKI